MLRVAFLLAIALGALGQQIVGARAGLVTYIEGSAAIDAKRAAHGRYWQVRDGEALRTTDGLVEIQMSAGSLLRLARSSELRMIKGNLDDAQALLHKGSAILEIVRLVQGHRLRLMLAGYTVEATKPGVYRFDVSPPRLRVYGGEASVEVTGRRITLKRGDQLLLSTSAERSEFDRKNDADAFHIWCAQRSFRVYRASAENRRKQEHWQRFSYNRFWNESFAVEMPPRRR